MTSKKAKLATPQGFQQVWYLKLNDPISHRALWIRFSLLSTHNGFKRIAETWAVYFQRGVNREVKKVAIKQTYDMKSYSKEGNKIRIGECELSENHTRGFIQSKGNSIQWDFSFLPARKSTFSFVPEVLSRSGLVRNSIVTQDEELLFTGSAQINGEKFLWKESPGILGIHQGSRNGHSWVWGQCNTFLNEQGKNTNFIFEGLTARTQIGPFISPKFSSFYFNYQDQEYFFNSLKDAIFLKSQNSLNEWKFQADRGDISFRGSANAEYKDFAGLTFEDTNGSLLYCSNSKLSDMKVLVYKAGKLEATFSAQGTAAFEVVSREKNPYVPILI